MSGLTELAGKTALVTGGAKRLGAAVVRMLANRGVHCVVHFRDSSTEARVLAEELRDANVSVYLVQGDLSQPDEASRVWDDAVAQAGTIDFLINSASIFPEGTLADLSVDTLQENVNVNAMSPLYLTRKFAATGCAGVVVNFLDTMVRDYDKKHVAYHVSKKMLHDLTRMTAVEYAPRLRVNAVAPGLVLPPAGKDETYLEGLKHSNPLQNFGSAEQITHAVAFLLTNEFITGQTIYVDGGRNLRGSMYE